MSAEAAGVPDAARQASIDKAVSARINQSIKDLRKRKADIDAQVSETLAREALAAEQKDLSNQDPHLHSKALKRELETIAAELKKLEVRTGPQWDSVDSARASLVSCLAANPRRALDCSDLVQKFRASVAEAESVSV